MRMWYRDTFASLFDIRCIAAANAWDDGGGGGGGGGGLCFCNFTDWQMNVLIV